MDGQMAATRTDLAPKLKLKCHTIGSILFFLALILDGGIISSCDASEGKGGFLDSSLEKTTIGIETYPKDEANEGEVEFTNGFGARPRLFEPHSETTTTATTTAQTVTISPTRTTFRDSILETKLKDTSRSKVTNERKFDVQTELSSSNHFLSTSLSDSTIFSSIVQTDSLPVNALSSDGTEKLGQSPSTPIKTVSSTEINTMPVTTQSKDSTVHISSLGSSETVGSSNYNANSHSYSIHFSSLATSVSSTPVLVSGTTVRRDQMHSEGLDRIYDDEVIVALPGIDTERNVIGRVDQAHEYVSIGATLNSTLRGNGMIDATAPALVMTSPPDSASDLQEPSSESQVRKEESHIAAGTIAGIVVASIGFAAIVAAALGFAVFRRLHILRNKAYDNKFSNDTCSYLDSLQVSYINSHIDIPKESNDEMFSLDNDSFLNSLEAMTMENYWAEDSRNTKV